MSSTTNPAASASPSVPSQDGHGPGTSSNLYLVTFLATLFLLLFVSCAIVLRSYILRRRYQRRLDEAMAAGMLLAPRTQGSKRRRFGAKPKLYDAWVAAGGETWNHIKPLSAQPVFVKRKYKEAPTKHKTTNTDSDVPAVQEFEDLITNGIRPPSQNASQSTPTSESQQTALRSRVRNLWSRSRRADPPPHADPADAEPEGALTDNEGPPAADNNVAPSTLIDGTVPTKAPVTTTGYKVRVEMLQVSVLIAMPSQSRTLRKNAVLDRVNDLEEEDEDDDDDEDDAESKLPELVFGITRVHHRQPKADKNGAASSKSPTTPTTPVPPHQNPPTMSVVPEEEEP